MPTYTTTKAGPTDEEIVSLYHQRKRARDPRLAVMADLLEAYEGRMAVPLPEMGRQEKPMVANLVASGLDQYSQRIASTLPDVWCPPTRDGDFDVHNRRAQERRNAIKGWWSMNRMHLLMRKRARFLIGYASAPVVIRHRAPLNRRSRDIPYWQLRDPMTAFPPPGDELDPTDCIFTFRRTYQWLRDGWPDAAARIQRPKDCPADTSFDILEYVDDNVLVLLALSSTPTQESAPSTWDRAGTAPFVRLERTPNLAKICPAVVPGRISLGDAQGQFDGLLGLYWWQSKLMALGGIAAELDIFPEQWAVSRPNEIVEVTVPADGPKGVIGEISGGDIKTTHAPPGQMTMLLVDRTERAMRVGGAVPAEFGGESPTNIRTARRGQEVLSSAVDFPIQEAQEILAAALQEENVRAMACAKAYHPSGPRSFYYSWNGAPARAEYDPATTFDSDENVVTYSMPGSDMNSMVIAAGQRIGMGGMSKYRWMEIDPLIDDPEREHGRIVTEGLEQALLQGLQTMASQPGGIPVSDLARIATLVINKRKTLFDAVDMVQKEAQRRQASAGEVGTEEGPALPGAPEAQPGLAMPGQGAEVPTVPEPPQGMGNLQDLMSMLR